MVEILKEVLESGQLLVFDVGGSQQGPGEAIFVPSGWFHVVENLEDTLSINHNWFNAHNCHWAWQLLRVEHQQATAALEDCR